MVSAGRPGRLARRRASSRSRPALSSAGKPKLATTFCREAASDSTQEMIAPWKADPAIEGAHLNVDADVQAHVVMPDRKRDGATLGDRCDRCVSDGPRLLRIKLRIDGGGKSLPLSDLCRKLNQLPMCSENSLRFSRSSGRNAFGCPSLWPSVDISAPISSRPL